MVEQSLQNTLSTPSPYARHTFNLDDAQIQHKQTAVTRRLDWLVDPPFSLNMLRVDTWTSEF